jgi:diacylglycerol kinase
VTTTKSRQGDAPSAAASTFFVPFLFRDRDHFPTPDMSVTLRDAPPRLSRRPARRRAAWRQWLVEAERGITAGFRSDSVFFVHLFAGSLAVAAAAMLGLSATQWSILVLALSGTISAELFHQVLKQLNDLVGDTNPKSASAIRRLGAAAGAAATLGSAASIAVILGSRIWSLFD